MTVQRKLLLGFALMVLPAVLLAVEAYRSNSQARQALETLRSGLSRTRTYAEVETAMFNQSEAVWRYLSGLEPGARAEYDMAGEVVEYWMDRWTYELRPDEQELAQGVKRIQAQMKLVADSVFALSANGRRAEAYRLARRELKGRLLPALTELNHEIYRRAREFSVNRAFARVEEIIELEGRILIAITLLAVVVGLGAAWLIWRSLARPITELRHAMARVGAGDLAYPIATRGEDEIADLARAFAQMTANLRRSEADLKRLNTELEAKIAQLEQAQAQLVQSEKLASIGEMAAAVAHGLRNPLASLRASAQLALRHPGSPASRDSLAAIIDQVDRLDRRIAHLLSFSRPARFTPVRERVADLVAGVQDALGELLRERRVEVELDLPDDLPEVLVEPMNVEQALLEVASNSIQAMPGGGRLTVRARPSSEDGIRGVALELTDTGKGIPADILPSVTDPFFTTRDDGTGLGLAVAKRFVEQNRGRLTITSRVGEGTTVRIWLPGAEAWERPAALASAPSGAGQPG
ncbi:MAG TPA: ATP-binding protein [Gemmatimonadales bacterium]|jgi:signal transduction histidine kinase|nr:ATP-binding protein [Gemmatimonadales bacterium]